MRSHQHTRRHHAQQQGRTSWLAHVPQAIVILAIFAIVAYAGWAFKALSSRSEHSVSAPASPPVVRILKSAQLPPKAHLAAQTDIPPPPAQPNPAPPPHAPSPAGSPPPPPSFPPPSPPPPTPPPPSPPPPSPPPPSPSPPPPLPPPPSPSPPPPSPSPPTGQETKVGNPASGTFPASTSAPSASPVSTKAATASSPSTSTIVSTAVNAGPGDEPYEDVSSSDFSYVNDDPGHDVQDARSAIAATTAATGGDGGGVAATVATGGDSSQSGGGGGGSPVVVSGRMGRSVGSQLTRAAPGGTLFSWGLQEWRLGKITGDPSVPEAALPNLTVISVAASRHSAIVTADGVVWTMGHNDSRGGGGGGSPPLAASGQLGRDGGKQPGPVSGPLAGKFVVQAVAGRYHTLAVTSDGQLYSWGLNDWGQLGRQGVGATSEEDPAPCASGPSCHSGVPGLVSFPSGVSIVGAAAGRYVSMALDQQGRLYTWGHDGCSNGGKVPAREEAYKPRVVEGEMTGQRVVAFDAGYVFWLAATEEGQVFTCDSQDDGYAGTLPNKRVPNDEGELGREGGPFVPGRVGGVLVGQKVEVVAAGREHAVVATSDGRVFTWGGRDLLMGRSGSKREPGQALGELLSDNIRFVSAGEYHSGAASETMVYGWGGNDYLCTGVGKNNPVQRLEVGSDRGDVLRPSRVRGPLASGGWRVQGLVAGFQHALAIAAHTGGGLVDILGNGTSNNTSSGAAAAAAATTSTPSGATASPSQSSAATPAAAAAALGTTTTGAAAGAATGAAGAATNATKSPLPYTDPSSPDYPTRYLAPQLHAERYNVSLYYHRFRRSDRFPLIEAESPDVWKVLPGGFDPRFKNPCWHQGGRGLRCVPYFHILGVSKCGTTDLYHRLSKHPQLYESRNKGPHWWDECPHPPKGECTAPPNGDFDGYVELFADAAAKIANDPQGITGEASSNTFTAAAGVYMRGPSMDRNTTVTMPELMREAAPFQHNIVIFRNPVDRYFSAFYYYRWWIKDEPTPGPEDFHKTAVQDIATWKACAEKFGQKYCVRHYNPQQLVKGMYSDFIMDWLTHWPRDQLLFLRNEDYAAAPREHMEAVINFLDMRQPSEQEWETIMSMATRNKNSDKYRPMLPETRQILEEFYRPFNERLAHVLGDDRWLWRDPPKVRRSQSDQQIQAEAGSDAAAGVGAVAAAQAA